MARRARKAKQSRIDDLLGPLEVACLRVLWGSAPASVGDVLKAVNEEQDAELAYTTVMTVLARLHEKGYATRRRQGRGYRYQPAYTEEELVELLGRREVDRVVERYGEVALACFVETLQHADPGLLRRVTGVADEASDA